LGKKYGILDMSLLGLLQGTLYFILFVMFECSLDTGLNYREVSTGKSQPNKEAIVYS
jgi:hypothetical protein